VNQVVLRWPVFNGAQYLGLVLPILIVLTELFMAYGLWRRRGWVWVLGICFHIPLTATLAPAFGLVMLSGYVATLTPRQAVWARRAWRRWSTVIMGTTALVLGALLLFEGQPGDWWTQLKIAGCIGLLLWALLAHRGWTTNRGQRGSGRTASLILALWIGHGVTPYLGIQYQHTGAMLSNLRIDEGCHNSWVFPEVLRGQDPYIRIDQALIGDGQRPQRERVVESTLWNLAALHTMRRNWCIPELRPIRFSGRWRGNPFSIDDLCADDWANALPDFGGSLSGFQRFQKNLPRSCPSACIH
jgi:hypothetical protein